MAGVLACSLVACSTVAQPPRSAEARIVDVRSGGFIDERELVRRLVDVRFRLLGEVHDNPAHHEIRARLIRALAATGKRPTVVFEQFDLGNDGSLIAAQAAGADAEQLAKAGHLDSRSWLWPLHKPVLQAAIDMRLPVRAGNLARTLLRPGAQTLLDDNGPASERLRAAPWTQAQAALLQDDIVGSHCGSLPVAAVPRVVLAQRMRDAAMAQALVDDANADGAILIAGDGHVRSDLGVPVYLHAPKLPGFDASSLSVGFVEVTVDDEKATDFPRRVLAGHPGFDYMWLTRSPPREDPCEGMRAPAAPVTQPSKSAG